MPNLNTKLTFMEAKVKKRTGFSSPCKIQNEKKTAKEFTQIYSFREGEDSAGDFGLERTGKINSRII